MNQGSSHGRWRARRVVAMAGLAVALASATPAMAQSATPAMAQDDVVLQWNDALLQTVRTVPFLVTARALAILHTSIYDAWAAYDPVAVGTRFGGDLRRPAAEHTDANKAQAISFAAYRALVDLFPDAKVTRFDPLMASLGYDPADTTTDTSTPTGIGNIAAEAVLAFRHADGSNQLGDLSPGAYSDYTNYKPVNDPDHLDDPNRWQPLRNNDGTVQRFLMPHWGQVTPFALSRADEFRPAPPPLYPDPLYQLEATEVLDLSGGLDDVSKTVAEYWATGAGGDPVSGAANPPAHWNILARVIAARDAHTLDENVKLFFALANAQLDVSVAVWECKRFYDYVRPVSAVRFLYKDQPVLAWAGPSQGVKVIRGDEFRSYLPTPAFAEYVAGHPTFSTASAEILESFTGSDDFGGSVTIAAGSSRVEPGVVPASDVTLEWATFSAAADQAGLSRRYGGIHFLHGDFQGRILGRKIGAKAWAKALGYFDGTGSACVTPTKSSGNGNQRQAADLTCATAPATR
jgi:hypothetical protein